jgi:hypothetical protein
MHLGLKGRKQKKLQRTVSTQSGTGQFKMAVHDHPGTIMGFHFDPPAVLFGVDPKLDITAQVTLTPVVPDFQERLKRMGRNGLKIQLGGGISAETFARLLAKIAHAYAVAQFGLDGFIPCLPRSVIGDPPYTDLIRYVGSSMVQEGKAKERHQIWTSCREDVHGNELLVVYVRLFGDLGMPSHYVVVGTRQ